LPTSHHRGIDPSGGAGVFADLKGILGARRLWLRRGGGAHCAEHAGRDGVHTPPVDFLRLQIDTLFADVRIDAVKIGMLASAEIVGTVPTVSATSTRGTWWSTGDGGQERRSAARPERVAMLREALLPLALVVTPNLPEAGVLLGRSAPDGVRDMYRAAEALRALLPSSGEHWVLLRAGTCPRRGGRPAPRR